MNGAFVADQKLPGFTPQFPVAALLVGVQIRREICFPGQWRTIVKEGPQAFAYMTNGCMMWFSGPCGGGHLVSRATETNRGWQAQLCPSMIIQPSGLVVREAVSDEMVILRTEDDTALVSDWCLGQKCCRLMD